METTLNKADLASISTKQLLDYARVAEAAERYDDMAAYMAELSRQKLAAPPNEDGSKEFLGNDERNLLSVAYKNVVGSKRSSWRTLSAGQFDEVDAEQMKSYKRLVEAELEAVCKEVLQIIDSLKDALQKAADDGKLDEKKYEDLVFYYKMGGDYCRYLAEFQTDDEKIKNKTKEYYAKALEEAEKHLKETHPTRLGLALNYSVCHYEILKDQGAACELAKKAFDAAIEKLDTLGDNTYKDSTLIMQLLRDNLTLWTSSDEAGDEDGAKPDGDS